MAAVAEPFLMTVEGIVNLSLLSTAIGIEAMNRRKLQHNQSGKSRRPGHLVPSPESFTAKFSVIIGGEQVASRAEVRSNDAMHFDKPLGVPTGFEPTHSPLPLARRLMRILRPVVQVAMLSMGDARHDDPFRRPVTPQLIRNNDARFAPGCP